MKSKVNYAQSIIKLTNILLSSLHVWSLDSAADKQFVDRLNMQKPKYPISFGRISRGAHLFVMFPPKKTANGFISTSKSFDLINFEETNLNNRFVLENKEMDSPINEPLQDFQFSAKSLNTEHMLTILSISNSFMSLENFIDLHLKNEYAFVKMPSI